MPRLFQLVLFSVVLSLSVGCREKEAKAGPAGGMPPSQVVVVEAKQQPVAESISLVGSLLANEAVEIQSEIEGTILEIKFNEGDRVEKGQLLVQLDERKLSASVSEAEANFKLNKANYDRAQQLFNDKLISKQEFDLAASTFQANEAALELKRQQLKDTRITAPFSGIVGARNVSPGQVIDKKTTITWLTDLDPVKLEVNVPERFITQLKVGQKIDLTVSSAGTNKVSGDVYFLSPAVDPATRTLLVKAKVPNAEARLKPGMLATLNLTLVQRDNAIVIPEAAIARVMDNDVAMIFTVNGSDVAEMKTVKLGVRLPGKVEILNGVEAGDRVIVEGLQKIGPGSKVKLAPPEAAAPYLKS